MHKILLCFILAGILFSCNAPSAQENKSDGPKENTSQAVEGKDYLLLKRFRVLDSKGFDQPLEVSSFMLPANWKVNSEVEWYPMVKCFPEMVQASVDASSPDGAYELIVFPTTQFDWSTDPIQLDAMQKGFYAHACTIAEPLDAAGYISQTLAPSVKASVKKAGIINELQSQMDAGAAQMTQQARAGGNAAYRHQGSAAEGTLQFSDGKEGLAFCTLMQTIVDMPGTQGGMSSNINCYVSMRVVLKYAAGNEAMARKIMSVFFSSARMNPQWLKGVQGYFYAVTSNAQNEQWKQIQISHQAQEEISKNIIRNWESKNNNNNTDASAATNDGFGQYLRGVDSWTDAAGEKVELISGYKNAWSRGDGSYMLSNDPSFDPNSISGETQNWNRMKQ